MSISWKLERIEEVRLEHLQERIGLEDREIISIALDVGFSACERAVERAADRIERAQDQLHRAALEEAEREAAERERHSLRGRWRRLKEALTTAWVASED